MSCRPRICRPWKRREISEMPTTHNVWSCRLQIILNVGSCRIENMQHIPAGWLGGRDRVARRSGAEFRCNMSCRMYYGCILSASPCCAVQCISPTARIIWYDSYPHPASVGRIGGDKVIIVKLVDVEIKLMRCNQLQFCGSSRSDSLNPTAVHPLIRHWFSQ